MKKLYYSISFLLIILIFLSLVPRSFATFNITAIDSTHIQFNDPQIGPFDQIILSSPNYYSTSVSCDSNHICTATFDSYAHTSRMTLRINGITIYGDNSVNWTGPGTTPTPTPGPTNTPTPTPANAFIIYYDPDYNNFRFTHNFSSNPVDIIATSADNIKVGQGSGITNGVQCSGNTCTFNSSRPYLGNLSDYVYAIEMYNAQGATLYSGPVVFPNITPTPTPANQLRVSGQFRDASGAGFENKIVITLKDNFTQRITTKTPDSNGNFSIPIVTNSPYLNFSAYNTPDDYNNFEAPNYFKFSGTLYYTLPNTTLNITLPVKKVIVHVKNQAGDVIPATIGTVENPNNGQVQPITIPGLVDVTGRAGDFRYTNSNGDAFLWLLTNISEPTGYTITARQRYNHPAYTPAVNQGISLVSGVDPELNFTVPFSHAQPVSTIALSPSPDGQGNYSNPVTVTLSATAASGYSISSKKYKVDNETEQTYTAPFTVTGGGSHTITYWATDNLGIYETYKTQTFTIQTPTPTPTPTSTPTPTPTPTPIPNVDPVVSGIANQLITTGQTYSVNGSFTDADSTSWSATVDYGEGAGAEILILNGNDFALNHTYQNEGTYTVTVQVHDNNGGVGTATAQITIHTVEPTTTISLAPNPDAQNEYPDPATVTLSAVADTGYTVTNTYYTIDGGSQQTYATPFTVSAPGNHTITYWSVDNVGLEETPHKSQTFTISSTVIADALPTGQDQTATVGDTTLTFSNVTSDGYVVETPISASDVNQLPSAYKLQGTYYELTTTASYTGTITVTFSYDPTTVKNINQLKLFHYNGTNWQDITTSIDTVNHTITGVTTSLSPFAVVEEDITAPTLSNFQLSQYVMANGNSSTISVTPQDDLTGIQSVSYSLTSSNGQVTTGNLSFISPSGVWQTTVSPTTGVYAVKVTAADFADNQKTSDNLYLAVYDASAGHVTGGGWIIPGAASIGVSSGGKANFGFNAKYQSGSSTPQGSLNMTYKQDDLEFKSTSLEWLSLSSGTADFEGQATVNGSGNYTFRAHVVDGSPDQLEIRVWEAGNSFDNPNYRISNNLGGGSIVIHQ